MFKLCPWGSLLLAPLWPLTFSSGERPRALWALLLSFRQKKYYQLIVTKCICPKFNQFLDLLIEAAMTIKLDKHVKKSYVVSICCPKQVLYKKQLFNFQCLTLLITNRVFKRSLDLLTVEQSTRIIFNSLEGNYALCLLGWLYCYMFCKVLKT